MSSSDEKISQEISIHVVGSADTWELAEKMIEVFDDAKRLASGSPRVRRVVRMCEVVKALRKEFSS